MAQRACESAAAAADPRRAEWYPRQVEPVARLVEPAPSGTRGARADGAIKKRAGMGGEKRGTPKKAPRPRPKTGKGSAAKGAKRR